MALGTPKQQHLKDAALALVSAHELPAGHAPDVQAFVEAAAGQQLPVGREGHASRLAACAASGGAGMPPSPRPTACAHAAEMKKWPINCTP